MPSAREHARTLRRHARTWFAPPDDDQPGAPDVTPASPESVIARATRDLLRAESSEDVARIVANTIDVLGGRVVPATAEDPEALPLDVSFGVSEPMLPTVDPGSSTRDVLARHLPALVADARQAHDTIVRTAHLSRQVTTDPVTGLDTRATFTRQLDRLRENDAAVVVRVTVPVLETPHPLEPDEALADAIRDLATLLQAQRGAGDHAARLEEDEFGLLLHQTGTAGTAVVVARLRRSWEGTRPGVTLHLGVAPFHDSGVATLRNAYEDLDRALEADLPDADAAPTGSSSR